MGQGLALNFGAVGADAALASITSHDHLDIAGKRREKLTMNQIQPPTQSVSAEDWAHERGQKWCDQLAAM